MIRRILVVASVVVFAHGCATVGSYQSSCEEQYSSFREQMNCTKAKVQGDWRSGGKSADLVRLYLNTIDVLVPQVEEAHKTEAQARLELSQLYVQLKSIEDDRDLQALQKSALWESIYGVPTPITTNCTTIGNSSTCTTY